jgi:site-specific DNA recombinase
MSSKLHEIWAYGDLDQKRQLQNLVFPSGIGYNKQNDRVQTKRVNSIFSAIPLLTRDLDKIKNGEPINFDQFSALVISTRQSSNFLEDFVALQKMVSSI